MGALLEPTILPLSQLDFLKSRRPCALPHCGFSYPRAKCKEVSPIQPRLYTSSVRETGLSIGYPTPSTRMYGSLVLGRTPGHTTRTSTLLHILWPLPHPVRSGPCPFLRPPLSLLVQPCVLFHKLGFPVLTLRTSPSSAKCPSARFLMSCQGPRTTYVSSTLICLAGDSPSSKIEW